MRYAFTAERYLSPLAENMLTAGMMPERGSTRMLRQSRLNHVDIVKR